MKFLLPAVLSLAPSLVSAWGQLGHQTVGLLAQAYLLPGTIEKVQYYLNDTTPTYMGNIATWADSYRYTEGGAFSSGYHFVNGHDDPPPHSCKIEYPGDCPPEGCIVSAIANYTARLQSKKVEWIDKRDALRFLIHFLGDITQPLHTEAYGAGANDVAVTFLGKSTNLHAVWDTSIPNLMLNVTNNTPTFTDSLGWANNLAAKVNAGEFKREVDNWIRYHDVKGDGPAKSAAKWAQDSNKLVCGYVLEEGPEKVNGTEVAGGEYYEGSTGIVEMQIAKGGVRLAAWLNMIFEGRPGFN
ncbi:uncharacterized protein LAJ45_02189 [Morchella importuna]|uniref:uncharacterized protein n=1 Tax=Morchella importuna TaxID=1174673 RepID=UPI001E8DE615|nr:uncharacterized protein LAJ45_02189 [Morchella importuna]KAH8153377.1 hypothetical protein LAJ45_02189 [Morchella importuna]